MNILFKVVNGLKFFQVGNYTFTQFGFQLALAKLKLSDAPPPDMTTVDAAYRRRMNEMQKREPGDDLPDKCTELTNAMRTIKEHLDMD